MSPTGNQTKPGVSLRTPEDLGTLVRKRRKDLHLTQVEFADQAGVGRRFLMELEHGKPTAQLGKALQVLAMLGMALVAIDA